MRLHPHPRLRPHRHNLPLPFLPFLLLTSAPKNFSRINIHPLTLSVAKSLSFLEVSSTALRTQLRTWYAQLPFVAPHYAVKCNNDAQLLKWIHEFRPVGSSPRPGFDCASLREIDDACASGAAPSDIIYAQPCKKHDDIRAAEDRGVTLTVADSVEEIEKLGDAKWRGDVLVRLLVADGGSKQPFGKKFGAPVEWLPRMYDAAKFHGVAMTGFSFHVGSQCEDPRQYAAAIDDCKKSAVIAKTRGFETGVVDIGGGFVPNNRMFKAVAAQVRAAAATLPPSTKWLAEPGRFLAAPTTTLYTTVIGKKPVWPPPSTPEEPAWRLTVDESVYGCFSNIPFDGQKPRLEHFKRAVVGAASRAAASAKRRPTIVFGRTCDSGDLIDAAAPLSEVQVGDVFRVRNMGAYTTVSASEFNGFPKPEVRYA